MVIPPCTGEYSAEPDPPPHMRSATPFTRRAPAALCSLDLVAGQAVDELDLDAISTVPGMGRFTSGLDPDGSTLAYFPPDTSAVRLSVDDPVTHEQ